VMGKIAHKPIKGAPRLIQPKKSWRKEEGAGGRIRGNRIKEPHSLAFWCLCDERGSKEENLL